MLNKKIIIINCMLEKSRICYVQIKHIFAWADSTYFCAFHLSGEDDLSATEMYERPLSVITNPLGLWRVRVYCMSICVLMVFRRIYLYMFPGRDLVSVCLHDEGGGIYRHSVSFESYLERIFVWIVYCSVDARNCMYVLFEWGSIVNKQKCVWFPIYVDLEDEDVVLRANWIGICFSLKRWLNINEIWLYLFLLCGKLYIIYV